MTKPMLLAVATLVLLAAGIAHASTFIVTFAQVGTNVVATGSGTIDLTGLNFEFSTPFSSEMYPAHGIMSIGPFANVDVYDGTSGPFSFGPGDASFPINTSGDSVFLEDFGIFLDVPQGYVSGTPLSGSATYSREAGNGPLSILGLTPGTYTWTWNSGANSYVLEIPKFTVTPEPGSFLLLGSGVLVFAQVLRRKLL